MASNSNSGCDTPQSAGTRDLERQLARLLMPWLYFAPGERFFPVDLPSAARTASLWLADPLAQPPTATCEKTAGNIDARIDLTAATANHFTTVSGFNTIQKDVPPTPPFGMPVPKVDEVYQMYAGATLQAELTMYATVCRVQEVPNAHLFKGAAPGSKEVQTALAEGLIISYYMYFPACESAEFEAEGDWSGVSLLVPARPTQSADLSDPERLKAFLPVVSAYYRKATDGAPPSPYFVAANGGIRRWKDVEKGLDAGVGLNTHPIVYVSRGRHNCYYEVMSKTLPSSAPWQNFTPDAIENGQSTPGPADNALQGGGIEDMPFPVALAFPWMWLFAACATGCQYPASFDTSGPSTGGYVEGTDKTLAGDTGLPAATGSTYPPAGRWPAEPPPQQLAVRLEYVDLTNAEMAALWLYQGAWGAATQVTRTFTSDRERPSVWGAFRGARRPALAAWFLWNLFLDSVFGCGGNASATPLP